MKFRRLIALMLSLVLLIGILAGCGKNTTATPPENPVTPETPVVPDVPETPEVPEVPETPTTPDVPETPTVPETPEVPEPPVTPQVPETPEIPEVPPIAPPVTPPVEIPPEPEKKFTNPLTGEATEKDISGNRPYAVMLNNLTVALPQHGNSQADVIYEILAEGGITRMMALYQDVTGVGNIGSIRSARHYYLELAQGHDAIYIHAGGSPQAYDLINAGAIASVDGTKGGLSNKVFWRDQGRISSAGYEHSLFTSGTKLAENVGTASSIRQTHYDGFAYTQTFVEDGTPEGGMDAPLVRAAFTPSKKTSFQYNEGTGLYDVFEYGSIYVDGNSGSQVSVNNVLCLRTDVSNIPGDTAGRLNVRTTGEGTGYYACGGKAVEIKWSRASTSAPMVYTLKDGTPLELEIGTSYVCVLSSSSAITFTP